MKKKVTTYKEESGLISVRTSPRGNYKFYFYSGITYKNYEININYPMPDFNPADYQNFNSKQGTGYMFVTLTFLKVRNGATPVAVGIKPTKTEDIDITLRQRRNVEELAERVIQHLTIED